MRPQSTSSTHAAPQNCWQCGLAPNPRLLLTGAWARRAPPGYGFLLGARPGGALLFCAGAPRPAPPTPRPQKRRALGGNQFFPPSQQLLVVGTAPSPETRPSGRRRGLGLSFSAGGPRHLEGGPEIWLAGIGSARRRRGPAGRAVYMCWPPAAGASQGAPSWHPNRWASAAARAGQPEPPCRGTWLEPRSGQGRGALVPRLARRRRPSKDWPPEGWRGPPARGSA